VTSTSVAKRLLLFLVLAAAGLDFVPTVWAGSPNAPLAQMARRGKKGWDTTSLLMYGGGGAAVVILIAAVMMRGGKNKKEIPTTLVSDVLDGYRLQKLMMTGQTSQVWEVVEVSSNRHFAMKMLLPEKVEDEEHRRLLFHEATVGIKLAHPNIIRIVKLQKQGLPYFVMEYFPAGNLKLRIMHKKWDFIKEFAHGIFKQAATALAYMNASGWVHRDVKPDNIMVNSAGEVRIIDFALAQPIDKGGLFRKRKGRTAGTKSYMSPEQVRGEGLDGRADIYSFGATMYEVVTGRPPFRASTPNDLLQKQLTEKPAPPKMYNAEVTDEFSALVLRMLAKNKEHRPRDFHEVLMALQGMKVFASEPAPKAKATE
jgi:eukaryotic-like serine/threonine-protein kinase